MVPPSSKTLDIVGTLVRWGLAAIWLSSGVIKAIDLNGTYATVKAYQLFPEGLAGLIAAIVPFLEIAIGLLLLAGIGTRLLAAFSVLLLLAYIGGIAQSWARGLSINCGCFGGGGQVAAGQTHYPREILVDVGFLALPVWLLVRPRTLLAVDGWLARHHGPLVADGGDGADEFIDDSDSSKGPAKSAVGRA